MLYLTKVITGGENDSYVISIALEWHEAIKTRREQAFRIREPELRDREQENKPGTGELIITCDNMILNST